MEVVSEVKAAAGFKKVQKTFGEVVTEIEIEILTPFSFFFKSFPPERQ